MRGREIKISEVTEKEIGYLVGLFLGDGYIFHDKKNRHYSVEFYLHSNETETKDFIVSLLRKTNLRPSLYKDKRYSCIRIRVRSKRFFEFITKETRNIRNNTDFDIGFISGLIDSDGYVNMKKRYIQVQNTNPDIMVLLRKKLSLIGLKSEIKKRKKSRKDRKDSLRLYIPFKFMETNNISIKLGSTPGCTAGTANVRT